MEVDHLAKLEIVPGQVIAGRYKLAEVLGKGGFGTVFRATHLELERDVALKIPHHEAASSRTAVKRFLREAKLALQLEHPNTVRTYDFGQLESGFHYIAYQLLRGRSLEDRLTEIGALGQTRTIHIGRQVLSSLSEAHQLGIVHRDIKPGNVFLMEFQGQPDFVKVLDFGLAKPVGPDMAESVVTGKGVIVGTPAYMSPEQIRLEPISFATDIYALGLMMSEMLTGREVFVGSSPLVILAKHILDEPAPLPDSVLMSELGPIIVKATHKSPDHRYQDATEMLGALQAIDPAPEPLAPIRPGRSAPQRATSEEHPSPEWHSVVEPVAEVGIGSVSSLVSDGTSFDPPSSTARVPVGGDGSTAVSGSRLDSPRGPKRTRPGRYVLLGLAGVVLVALGLGIGFGLRHRRPTRRVPDLSIAAATTPPREKAAPVNNSRSTIDSVVPEVPMPTVVEIEAPPPAPLEPVSLARITTPMLIERLAALGWSPFHWSDTQSNTAKISNIAIGNRDCYGTVSIFDFTNGRTAKAAARSFNEKNAAGVSKGKRGLRVGLTNRNTAATAPDESRALLSKLVRESPGSQR